MTAFTGQIPGVTGPAEVVGPVTNGLDETWVLTIGGTPTSGTFKLPIEGILSAAITWSATNNTLISNINTALDAHPSLGVAGGVAAALNLTAGIGTIRITLGANRGRQANLSTMFGTPINSLAGTAPTVAIAQEKVGVTATLRGSAPGQEIADSSSGQRFVNIGTALAPDYRRQAHPQYTIEEFETIPGASKNDGYSDPTGATGDINLLKTERNIFEYHIKGTQTILKPAFGANGLDVGFDQTDNDGVEITQGITARSKGAFTIGTDRAFFASLTFSIEDVSGTDDCAFGFRTAEAYQANIDDYNNMAVLNVISGDIKIETIDDNGATTTTDTTDNWADGETHTLTVKVSAAGVVTYEIDGRVPTTVAAFTIDSGDVVVPFFFMLNAADVVGAVNLKKWEAGLQ